MTELMAYWREVNCASCVKHDDGRTRRLTESRRWTWIRWHSCELIEFKKRSGDGEQALLDLTFVTIKYFAYP